MKRYPGLTESELAYDCVCGHSWGYHTQAGRCIAPECPCGDFTRAECASHALRLSRPRPAFTPQWAEEMSIFECNGCGQYFAYAGDGEWLALREGVIDAPPDTPA